MTGWNPKQYKAWQLLWDNITQYLFFGGAKGGGKSVLGCSWLHTCCSKYENVRYLMGRKELKNLKETTLNTYYKVLRGLDVDINKHIQYNEQKSLITYRSTGSEIILKELKQQPSDPLFQSLGSLELTGAFIDEAPEIAFSAFDTLKSCIGRQNNEKHGLLPAKILLTGNPTKNWVYHIFWKPFVKEELNDIHAFIKALPNENKYLDKGYIDNNLNSLTDPIARQRFLQGIWDYDDDPGKLINYDSIIDIFGNSFIEKGKRYITCDAARFGSDKAVILIWEGFRIIDKVVMAISSTVDIQDIIKEKKSHYEIPLSRIIVDEDGVGGGIVDNLGCRGFINNSRPMAMKGQTENYANLKTQCYYLLARRINDAGVYICPKVFNETEKNELTEELEQVKRGKLDQDGKLCLVSKKELLETLGRSPDYADAMMMREYFEIVPVKSYYTTPVKNYRY